MLQKPISLFVALALTAAGAFALGWIARPVPKGIADRATEPRNKLRSVSKSSRLWSNSLAKQPWDANDTLTDPGFQAAAVLSSEAISESVSKIVNTRNPIRQAAMFSALLEGLTPENALAAFEALRQDRDGFGKMRGTNMRLLLNAWGQIDGVGALKALNAAAEADRAANGGRGRDNQGNGNDPDRDYLAGIYHTLSGLAVVDPAAATDYLNELEDLKQRDKLMSAVVDGILVDGVDTAVDFIAANTESGKGRDRYMAKVARSVLEGGLESGKAWLDSLPNEMRKGAIDRIADRYGREDLSGAVGWIEKYAGEPYATDSLDDIAESWAESDPRAASDWATELPEEAQPGVYREAMDEWAESDPVAASEYLSKLTEGAARDSAVEGFAKELVKTDPKTAAAWAETITTEPQYTNTLAEVTRRWLKSDPDAARTWISGRDQEDK